MKVNFTMWEMGRSGGNRVLFELANRLERRAHRVTFTALGCPGTHKWFPLSVSDILYPEKKLRVPITGWLASNTLDYALSKLGLPYLIDRIKVLAQGIPSDVDVNVATYCFTAFAVHRSGRGKMVYYIQHYEPLFFEDRYLRNVANETYYLPLSWIVNSSWARNLLSQKFGKDGELIIPGVDAQVFCPRDVPCAETTRTVICLGKSHPIKDLGTLFTSLKLVRQRVPNLQLILYGSEPWLTCDSPVPCKYVVRPSDEDLARLYSLSDVALTPSMYESSPLPPLEAMACGTPVVTTRFGTEDYCFHEQNSLVVPPRHPKLMAEAIIRVLNDQRLAERLRREGLETARRSTWEETTCRCERFLTKIVRA